MLKLAVLLAACVALAAAAQTPCHNYKTHVQPLIERGDVKALQQVFAVMNSANRSVASFRLPPIEDSVWPEVAAVRRLVSLSRPQLKHVSLPERWPDNNNIRVSESGVADTFSPLTSYHGGLRYIYNCATVQQRSCFKDECRFDPSKPLLVARKDEEIYVPLDNFLAANGDAMADHVTEDAASRTYVIKGFSRMTVSECGARQVFFNGTGEADCFDQLKFFSLPEAVEYRSMPEDDSTFEKKKRKVEVPQSLLFVKRSYFAIMS